MKYLLPILILLCSCARVNHRAELNNSLLWKPTNTLIAHKGPPTRIMPGQNDGQIWVYQTERVEITPGYTPPVQHVDYGNNIGANALGSFGQGLAQGMFQRGPTATRHIDSEMFFIDSTGHVHAWSETN